jgi:hypothetical protein
MLFLQNRWKLDHKKLVYYGMRNQPYLLKNHIKLNEKQVKIVKILPSELSFEQQKVIQNLIKEQIVCSEDKLKKIPQNLDEATFCKTCVANDFIIPGLEFNDEGHCPMCQTKDEVSTYKSVLPVVNDIKRQTKNRFDIALFYTGGKDSSFLLHYLANELKLKVLAFTWEIPFMSESAIQSIDNAKKKLHNVEFITRKMADADLLKIYHKLYELERNTCACPSLAYVLFYPEMVHLNIPYFVLGNEPIQMLNLYYNRLAPKAAYQEKNHKLLTILYNILRVFTLKPPLKKGQLQTLMTMKQLAYGDNIFKKLAGYENTLVSNVTKSLHEVLSLLKPLKKAIRKSSRTGHIPAFVHIDFNDISNGLYDWQKVKSLIEEKVGWVGPKETAKGLHTSCSIEKCKEYSQFINFYEMRTQMIPFSAIEISLASQKNHLNREMAIKEMKENMGFSLEEVRACEIMKDYLKLIERLH